MQRADFEQQGAWAPTAVPGQETGPGVEPQQAPDPVAGFNILSQSELFGPLPDVEFLVEKILPAGALGMIAGRAATLKTMMALDMAIAITTNGKFLGQFDCKHRYVLYLNYENPKVPFLWRLQRLTYGRGLPAAPVRLGHFPRVYLHQKEFLRHLEAALSGPAAPSLVIVDTLRAAMPGVDENDSGVRAPLDEIRRVIEGSGASMLFLHHAGKGNSSEDSIRGSSALRDALDVAFVVTPTDAERTVRLKQSKARDHEAIAQVDVKLDILPTGHWRLVTVDEARDAARDRSAFMHAIIDHLQHHPKSLSSEVAKALGRRRQTVDQALELLVSNGAIVRTAHGKSRRYGVV